MYNNSIDEILGSEEFIKSLKYNHTNKNNNNLLNKFSEDKLYLTITNTKTNQSELYILNLKKPDEYNNTTKQLDVSKNYKNCA